MCNLVCETSRGIECHLRRLSYAPERADRRLASNRRASAILRLLSGTRNRNGKVTEIERFGFRVHFTGGEGEYVSRSIHTEVIKVQLVELAVIG